ncbi:MAG TPA: Asp-tRNA(Asn)/Glu-tRNA(Gln) amidotransferase subunit GatB [Acidimicrobiales bacterium]|nr:Asp-tRNA(Asn)/Glu-tRNA(Gln) amidotransferase subunit GatB [Acidimicrobiales bacterium]
MSFLTPGWELTVGLEVHCELQTKTKLFCSCANVFGEEPNTNVCPVCLGLPGSLPVLNRMAVEYAMRIGIALNCRVEPSIFHRKNYFYPDMPKDYQVSQYDAPINVDGFIELPGGTRVGIERAHLEEDTGKTSHMGGGGRIHDADYSLVDYNRAGVPLVEIVSRPDITSPEDARAYVSELRSILVASGASDGRMEEGSLRVDANVSMRRTGTSELGTRCEVKNMNSLRSLGRAIEYEALRQVELLESGDRVVQETRHWNENEGRTSSLRSKEEAFDYRYFPEPDLVALDPEAEWIEAVRKALPQMPSARRAQLGAMVLSTDASLDEHALSDQIATVVDLGLDQLVTASIAEGADGRLALARCANEAATRPDEARALDPTAFCELILLESSGKISATQSKAVLGAMLDNSGTPAEIIARLGFEGVDEDRLGTIVDEIITANPKEWQRFVEGDEKVAQFLFGQVMKQTKGQANGKLVAQAFNARKGS